MKIKKEAFGYGIYAYNVTITDETMIITEILTTFNRHITVEIPHSVFKQIVKWLKEEGYFDEGDL